MWSSSFIFISNRFCRTLNNFVPLNDHIIAEFPWVVTMAPAVHSTDILWWTVTSHWHRQDDCNCGAFAISEHTKWFPGLVIQRSGEEDTERILWLALDAISCVTWLVYWSHRRRIHGSNFLTAVTYSTQSNSKLFVQKNNYVPNSPVELAHCSYYIQHVED